MLLPGPNADETALIVWEVSLSQPAGAYHLFAVGRGGPHERIFLPIQTLERTSRAGTLRNTTIEQASIVAVVSVETQPSCRSRRCIKDNLDNTLSSEMPLRHASGEEVRIPVLGPDFHARMCGTEIVGTYADTDITWRDCQHIVLLEVEVVVDVAIIPSQNFGNLRQVFHAPNALIKIDYDVSHRRGISQPLGAWIQPSRLTP